MSPLFVPKADLKRGFFSVEPTVVTDTLKNYAKRTTETTAKYLGVVKDAAAASAVTCNTVRVEHGHPYQAIIDTAKKRRCDLIVMTPHGRHGVSAIVLGSETVKVLTHSTIRYLYTADVAITDITRCVI